MDFVKQQIALTFGGEQVVVCLQQESIADSVAYCHLQYDEEGNCMAADFYRGLEMDEKTLRQRTADTPGTDYIGAVHRMK
ncbi:MAG: hypothetical protein FWC27_12575 [Firmicutes bacterium]|nr:hypothetical protein [Bacillota bacterium]